MHQPYALRAIIQLDTDAGLVGLGETYADTRHLARLQAAADAITGLDVFALNAIRAAIADRLRGDDAAVGTAGMITTASAVDQVFSPFEVACLDVQGHATGRPVSDLLGGKVRDAVPFSAYLFYKWAAHPGAEPDAFGEALDPDGIVAQATRMIDEYGFTAIKLKGGVFPPEEEMAAIEALHAAFPDHPLRLDPNAAWTPQTSVKVASGLAGILEYLEDPTPGLDGMAEVAAAVADAVGHQHVRRRVRPTGARRRERLGARGAFGPSLLGRPAALAAARRHLRHLRARAVDALQLAPGHQPGRDGAPRRRHTEPHLRLRHPLAVEDRGGRQARRARDSRRLGRRCRPRPASASRSTRTHSPRCTSST